VHALSLPNPRAQLLHRRQLQGSAPSSLPLLRFIFLQFLLLHDGKSDDSVKSFFVDVHEA
jgi:hypothetical protein